MEPDPEPEETLESSHFSPETGGAGAAGKLCSELEMKPEPVYFPLSRICNQTNPHLF